MPAIGLESPVTGLNSIDSVDAMAPTDAIILNNWIPRSGFCESRPGHSLTITGLGGPVETLTAYKGTGTWQLIAGANGKLFDVTAASPVEIGTGYGNDRWQTAMINNRLVFCNGDDPEMAWDGAAFTALDYTGSSPAITPGEFIGVCTFKGRAYYWKANAQSFWYAQAGSYQGNLKEFPLQSVVQVGGTVYTMFTWTVDSGTGPDDLLVIVFNTGEVLIYQGDDPDNLGFFVQVGRYEVQDPLSRRGWMRYGSDVVLMTRSGYVNLSTVMRIDAVADVPAYSRRIARHVANAGNDYAEFFGHEAVLTDTGLQIFNVPTSDHSAIQFVLNSVTGAWSSFTGLNAVTWRVFNDALYFGTFDGAIARLEGSADNGEPIDLQALPAYQYLDDPGSQKHITAAQIISTHPDPKLIDLRGYADFVIPELINTSEAPSSIGGSLWDEEFWNEAEWAGPITESGVTTKGWQNVSAFGFAVTVAVQMKTRAQAVSWRASGWRYNTAGAQ